MEGLILVRGAGDLATGVIHKLVRCGWPVLALELPQPAAIRRQAAFSTAVWNGCACVEGVTAYRADTLDEAEKIMQQGHLPILVDPSCDCLRILRPSAVVDAILAKKNLGTNLNMAPCVVALGPGFTAGLDCHAVVETMRGADLGRVYYTKSAKADTGKPGIIGGYGEERVLHAPTDGRVHVLRDIGERVEAGDCVAMVDDMPVVTVISGTVRGMLPEGYPVTPGFKLADVDPRSADQIHCDHISDKARCIAGGVVEVLLSAGVYPPKKKL